MLISLHANGDVYMDTSNPDQRRLTTLSTVDSGAVQMHMYSLDINLLPDKAQPIRLKSYRKPAHSVKFAEKYIEELPNMHLKDLREACESHAGLGALWRACGVWTC